MSDWPMGARSPSTRKPGERDVLGHRLTEQPRGADLDRQVCGHARVLAFADGIEIGQVRHGGDGV